MVSESQKEARRIDNGETYECERCGEDFDAYIVLIKDDFVSVSAWAERKGKYEHLCQDCNEEYFDGTDGFFDGVEL